MVCSAAALFGFFFSQFAGRLHRLHCACFFRRGDGSRDGYCGRHRGGEASQSVAGILGTLYVGHPHRPRRCRHDDDDASAGVFGRIHHVTYGLCGARHASFGFSQLDARLGGISQNARRQFWIGFGGTVYRARWRMDNARSFPARLGVCALCACARGNKH